MFHPNALKYVLAICAQQECPDEAERARRILAIVDAGIIAIGVGVDT